MSTTEERVPDNNQDSLDLDLIPPTDPPQDQVIRSLEARIAEQQMSNRRLESQINKILENQTRSREDIEPPPRNPEESARRYFTDPEAVMDARDKKLLSQMKEMIEPIREIAESFRGNREYDVIKRQLKSDPYFAKGLKDRDVEEALDQLMSQPGTKITLDSMKAAVASLVGSKMMGMFGSTELRREDTRDTRDTRDRDNDDVIPPHLPPTRVRRGREEVVVRELTENDRLAMKYANLNPNKEADVKEYWELMDAPADKLVGQKKDNK